MAQATRILFPFTHGIEVSAITSALAVAHRLDATLVTLSLIQLPQTPGKGPRWEAIQQSRDFLAFVQHKAGRSGVPIECVELRTHHPISSIRALALELECIGIILVVRRGVGVLLATHEVKQLLEDKRLFLYLISLPTKDRMFSLPQWVSRRFRRS